MPFGILYIHGGVIAFHPDLQAAGSEDPRDRGLMRFAVKPKGALNGRVRILKFILQRAGGAKRPKKR